MKIENINNINMKNIEIYPKIEKSTQQKIKKVDETQNKFKEEEKKDKNFTKEDIEKNIEKLNKEYKNTTCEFVVHEKTNSIMIKILDKETKKVIKEYPAEKTLDRIAKTLELSGLMLDRKL